MRDIDCTCQISQNTNDAEREAKLHMKSRICTDSPVVCLIGARIAQTLHAAGCKSFAPTTTERVSPNDERAGRHAKFHGQ